MTTQKPGAPRIKPKIHSVRYCSEGSGRPHWHVSLDGKDVVADGRFTFASEVSAQKAADKMNGATNGAENG